MFSEIEKRILRKLNTPKKIQDYLNTLKFNFEANGETCYSPRFVIKNKTAHCMEGAMLAWCALEFNRQSAWLLDLRATKEDFDHVVCVFKQAGFYGAISKTNHAVLRYREPVYKTVRELVLSYFHEYFLPSGKKTLREYSELFSLKGIVIPDRMHLRGRNLLSKTPHPNPLPHGEREDWRVTSQNLFIIPQTLDKIKHYKILNNKQLINLRPADKIEIQAGEIVEFRKK